jgi:RNA polymerase sigma factor (TIGR02999 family)
MRHILCNYGRDRRAQKRGGGAVVVSLEDEGVAGVPLPGSDRDGELLESLDHGLTALEGVHPRPARVVECRFFGGLSVEETAAALEVSPRTVKRDWRFAQAWLKNAMERS